MTHHRPMNGPAMNEETARQLLCPCGSGEWDVIPRALIFYNRLRPAEVAVQPAQGFKCAKCGLVLLDLPARIAAQQEAPNVRP